MKSWQKLRYDAILSFPKKYLILSYLKVTLSSCKLKDNFCLTLVLLCSQNLKIFCSDADWFDEVQLSGLKNLTGLIRVFLWGGKETLSYGTLDNSKSALLYTVT